MHEHLNFFVTILMPNFFLFHFTFKWKIPDIGWRQALDKVFLDPASSGYEAIHLF
jgi:hypothetical protein